MTDIIYGESSGMGGMPGGMNNDMNGGGMPGGMPGGMDRNRMSSNDTDNSNNAQADMNTPISV